MDKERNVAIDRLKGIGIIFVIIGHIPYTQENLFTYIYSFHMPLFFFISGYLIYGRENKKISTLIKDSFLKYMIPYYIFLLISIFFTETYISFMNNGSIFGYIINVKDLLLAFLLSGDYLNKIPCSNFPLWYLPLYFIARICFQVMIKNKKISKQLPIILVFLAIITIPFQNLLPGRPFLHINVLPAALVFMGIGYLFKKYEEKVKENAVYTTIALVIGILVAYLNGGNISEIINIIYFVGAFASIYFWYQIAKQSKNKILEYIGKGAAIIYPIHSLISNTYIYTHIDEVLLMKWNYDIMFVIIKTVYILVISALIYMIYHKMSRVELNLFSKNKRKENTNERCFIE